MTLREALVVSRQVTDGEPFQLNLCCGFEPLHLVTFLKAHLSNRLRELTGKEARPVGIVTGLFGDLIGNVERALSNQNQVPCAVVLEWVDIDPRLGLREAYIPDSGTASSILTDAAGAFARLLRWLMEGAAICRMILVLPPVVLPPWFPGLSGQAPWLKLKLEALLSSFAAECSANGVRVCDLVTGPAGYDIRTNLNSGFPYTNLHADAIAANVAGLLLPDTPKKGLVTDLDNTVWAGIVGDVGASHVHWGLENHSRIHGIYQQFLAGLAAQGTLIAIASKNDAEPVNETLKRPDLLLPAAAVFPIEASWSSKSESILRIAKVWNIGLDSIVFVDDNPLELAEVQQQLPLVECHLFPFEDTAAALALMQKLQARFAREGTSEEDRLRAASLRSGVQFAEAGHTNVDTDTLLAGLNARIDVSLSRDPFDLRSLELLNKTNQFNLNGRRWEENQFRSFLAQPDSVLAVVSYEDRFGKLGKIGVMAGELCGRCLRLRSWVLSCRAFSRRIEFSMVGMLFDNVGSDSMEFDWQSTPRNTPVRNTLKLMCGDVPDAGMITLTRKAFVDACPPLYATVGSTGAR